MTKFIMPLIFSVVAQLLAIFFVGISIELFQIDMTSLVAVVAVVVVGLSGTLAALFKYSDKIKSEKMRGIW